jgi:hypothetical protein
VGCDGTELVSEVKIGAIAQRENRWVLVDKPGKGKPRSLGCRSGLGQSGDRRVDHRGRHTAGQIFRALRKSGKVWSEDLRPGAVPQVVQQYARAMGLEKLALQDMRRTSASSAVSAAANSSK